MKGELVNINLIGNVFFTLLLMAILILAFAFLAKKFKKFSPSFAYGLQILGGTSLGGKSKVFLIEAKGIQMLIGVSDSFIQALHVFNETNDTTRDLPLEKVKM